MINVAGKIGGSGATMEPLSVNLANLSVNLANLSVNLADLSVNLADLSVNLANQETARSVVELLRLKAPSKDFLDMAELLFSKAIYELETGAVCIEEGKEYKESEAFHKLCQLEAKMEDNMMLKEKAEASMAYIEKWSGGSGGMDEWYRKAKHWHEEALKELDRIDEDLHTELKPVRLLVTISDHFHTLTMASSSIELKNIFMDAVKIGHSSLVELLLPEVDISHPLVRRLTEEVNFYHNSLYYAVKKGHTEIVRLLLENDMLGPTSYNNYLLCIAIDGGNTEIVKMLIAEPSIDPSVYNNQTLFTACKCMDIIMIRLLLSDERVRQEFIYNPDTHFQVVRTIMKARKADMLRFLTCC